MDCKKGPLRYFKNFIGKHLHWSPFLIRLQVWHLFWRISASNCFCTALAPINVISLLYIQHSVANKEIKLGQTFLSAVCTNFFWGGGGQKFYRLCIGLGWLKIGLNNNILLLFSLNTCLCNRKKILSGYE